MVKAWGMGHIDVLMALYNKSRPLGRGFMHFAEGDLPRAEAEVHYERARSGEEAYFDYLKGRVMKVYIPKGEVDTIDGRLYDRDNGEGAAKEVLLEYFLMDYKIPEKEPE